MTTIRRRDTKLEKLEHKLRFVQGRVSGTGGMEEALGGTYTQVRSHQSQRIEICGDQAKCRFPMHEITAANAGHDLSANSEDSNSNLSIIILLYVPEEKKTKKNYKTTSGYRS